MLQSLIRRLTLSEWLGALIAVIVLAAVLSVATEHFLSQRNLTNVLVQATVIALLAGGQTFVILMAGIDLSIASVAALVGALIGMWTVQQGLDPYLGIVLGIAMGAAIGVLNGTLITKVGLPPLIVTLGGLSLWRGLGFELTGGFDLSGMAAPIAAMGRGTLFSVPMPIILLFAYYITASFVLSHTKFGRYLYAIGSNEESARQAGIQVDRYKIGAYMVCSASGAFAALVLIGRQDSSGGKIAMDFELDAIAAVILGGTSLFGGRGSIWGSLLGALLISMIRNGLNLLGVSAFMQMIALGIVIVVAIWLDVVRVRRVARLQGPADPAATPEEEPHGQRPVV